MRRAPAVGLCAGVAVGAAAAYAGADGPAIVSVNGEPQVVPLIESGAVLATFDIHQERLGQALAYSVLSALCRRDLPDEIVVPVQVIDKSNVADHRPLEDRVDDPFHIAFGERDGRTFLTD